jgi:DNA-binding CsgD family transcriptional regulator
MARRKWVPGDPRNPDGRLGRPYKLSLEDHRELIARKRAGASVVELALRFNLYPHTVYQYLRLDPESRRDAKR